jgi:hypothetical protein
MLMNSTTLITVNCIRNLTDYKARNHPTEFAANQVRKTIVA